jgi:D-serine dehydratase
MPEPGLALLSAGRRDVSYDSGLPVPVRWCRQGEMQPRPVPAAQAERSDTAPHKPQAGVAWTVSGLNDQHAYLRLPAEEADELPRVGDRVALGISHPCTTFDKWRWMAVIDEQGFVVDALTTCF